MMVSHVRDSRVLYARVSRNHIALTAARHESTKKVQWSGPAEAPNSGYIVDVKVNGCLSRVIKGWMT
jgi:hypothetical protein